MSDYAFMDTNQYLVRDLKYLWQLFNTRRRLNLHKFNNTAEFILIISKDEHKREINEIPTI